MAKTHSRGTKIVRKAYTTRSGTRVSASLITKPGLIPGKSTHRSGMLRAAAKARSMRASRLTRSSSTAPCPVGTIRRAAYTRKSYTRKSGTSVKGAVVASECIKDVGKTGKGAVLITLDPEDHLLSEHGYDNVVEMTRGQRKRALMALIKHYTPIKGQMPTMNYVIRALNARFVLNRNTNPKVARIFRADQRMVSAMYRKMKRTAKKAM
jgi:hypothetical protein